jgi:hypothetical protein
MEQQNNSEELSNQENLPMEEPIMSSVSYDEEEQEYQEDQEDQEDDEDQQSDCSSDMGSENQKVAIDLSDNEFYKGICTLLEDDHGNNILEYISLLHTELIGVNKNLRTMNKNMNKIANCAELIAKKKA